MLGSSFPPCCAALSCRGTVLLALSCSLGITVFCYQYLQSQFSSWSICLFSHWSLLYFPSVSSLFLLLKVFCSYLSAPQLLHHSVFHPLVLRLGGWAWVRAYSLELKQTATIKPISRGAMHKLLHKPAHFGERKEVPLIIRGGMAGLQRGVPGRAIRQHPQIRASSTTPC